MKAALLLLLALPFSASIAHACPQLTGEYTCNLSGAAIDVSVEQGEIGGLTVYSFDMLFPSGAQTNEDYIVGGENARGMEVSCIGNTLRVLSPSNSTVFDVKLESNGITMSAVSRRSTQVSECARKP